MPDRDELWTALEASASEQAPLFPEGVTIISARIDEDGRTLLVVDITDAINKPAPFIGSA